MSDLPALLADFAAERVALIERHEASARAVSHYDFNNAYQYVINREETHLSWLQHALAGHRNTRNVTLGESLEHRRSFEQAAAGLEDLLGRRTGGVERVGAVLPT